MNMKRMVAIILSIMFFLNIVLPASDVGSRAGPFTPQQTFAIGEDANYWNYGGGGGWRIQSLMWNNKESTQSELWTWYVDGVNMGQMWCAISGGKGYNSLGPGLLSSWVSAFNGNLSYVQNRASAYTFRILGPRDVGTTFNRYLARDIIDFSGATLSEWDPNAKTARVITTKAPFGNISKPYSLQAGESGSFAITGTAYAGNSMSYTFKIDGSVVDSGTVGSSLNKSVSRTLTAGTHSLQLTLTDAIGRTSVISESITVTGSTAPTPPPVEGNDNARPSARFAMPSSASVGDTVSITESSVDSDGSITSRIWSITPTSGYTNGLTPTGGTLTFNSSGNYTVKLKVTDNKGATDEVSQTISVGSAYVPPPTPPPAPKYDPVASFYMPSTAGQGAAVAVTNHSYDPDGNITNTAWSISPSSGVSDTLGANGGTITFGQTGTYSVTLSVTDNDGLTNATTNQITVSNQDPVARITAPDEVMQGQDFTIASASFDPDGTISKTTWSVSPTTGLIGTLSGVTSSVYFDKEGSYTIGLTVEDQWGVSATATKTVTVKPAIPSAAFDVLGALKQNRKITLDSSFSTSPSRYPIIASKTEWEITPLTSGVTAADIKVDTASAYDARDVLMKKPGTYRIRLRVWNAKHASEWVEKQIVVGKDEPPVANFFVASVTTRDPENGNKVLIPLTDMSYTTDGDVISQRIWKYKFDSDNDGSFGDESWISISTGNNAKPVVQVSKVGKYLFELEVVEAFSEPTIAKFVTTSDRLRADTSYKPVGEKSVEVDNINPFVDFSVSAKKKADIVFTVGQADPSKVADLNGKIATYVTSKLAASNIDAKISTVQTTGMDLQNSFSWVNNVYSNIGSIVFQNNGSRVYMRGNESNPGFNHIYALNTDPEITKQKMSFSYNLDFGDSFDAAGMMINVSKDTAGLHGYMLALHFSGGAYLYRFSNWSSSYTEELYPRHWDTSTNPKAVFVGSVPISYMGTLEIESTRERISIKQNGQTHNFTLPTHYGWGFGFFSDHYSHGCDRIGQFAFDNLSVETVKGKSLGEVLKEPSWREGSKRFLVNINDVAIEELSDSDKVAILLSRTTKDEIDFDVLGTSANQAQAQSFIAKNSGNGVFYNNSNINTAMDNLGTYILNKVNASAKNNIKYVLLGEDVEYTTFASDHENDPEYARRWIYNHNPNYFQNGLGRVSYDNTYLTSPVTSFDKVGSFVAQFQVKDNPVSTDNRFDEYRKWSGMPLNGLTIYVHRKPLAKPTVSATRLANGTYRLNASEASYDLDHQSDANKGIITTEWKWKNVGATAWQTSNPNGQIVSAGGNYVVQLRVRDKDGPDGLGEWSDPVSIYVTTKDINLPPVALFDVSPNPLPLGKTIAIADSSYDPNGNSISERSWVVEKNGSTISTTSTAPTSTNFNSWGVGEYRITLKVKDSNGAWSDTFTQPLSVVAANRKPVASFSVSPNPVPLDVNVSYSETSSDPDGDPIVVREWRWKKTTSSSWTYGATPPVNFAGQSAGTLQIQLRVKDQPVLPQQDVLYSDWAERQLTLTAGNRAPTANFSVSPNPVPVGKSVVYTDTSSDPEGKALSARVWEITCNETGKKYLFDNTAPPTNFSSTGWGASGDGIGTYIITLKVKDTSPNGLSPELWSSVVSRSLTVVANNVKPVARFVVNPNPVPLDVDVSYSDSSYDPDGNPIDLRQWRWKYTTASSWNNVSSPPTSFDGWSTGIIQVQLRVRDKPPIASQDVLYSDWVEQHLTLIPANVKPVARFVISPNPVPADEPVTYTDTSYDPEGKALSSRIWVVTCQETGQTQQYTNTTPPTIFETTGWGVEQDGVGTYTITLKVKDTSPNGLSPELWSDIYSQVLVVETPLRITGLKMTSHINAPAGTVLPIDYPVAAPTSIKAGYKMTFSLFTNGGDTAVIKVFANGVRVPVQMDDGAKSEITVPTTRKNSVSTFTFWLDKDLPAGTVLDMKIELSKTKYDGSLKTLIDTILGERFGIVVGSSKQDSEVNLIK